MSSIKDNIISIKNQLPETVKLVAVSKTHPAEMIKKLILLVKGFLVKTRFKK